MEIKSNFQNEWAAHKKDLKVTDHPFYGKIEYDIEGLLICHICGRAFRKLAAHTTQKHKVDEREYKVTFGLCTTIGLVTTELKQKLSDNVKLEVIQKNLIRKGKHTRYRKGSEGRTKDKVCPQLKTKLKDNLKNANMVIAMAANGRKMGLSGLGNKKRWGDNNKTEKE